MMGESVTGVPFLNELTLMIHFVPPPQNAGPNALPRMRFVKEFVDSEANLKFYKEESTKAKLREAAGIWD